MCPKSLNRIKCVQFILPPEGSAKKSVHTNREGFFFFKSSNSLGHKRIEITMLGGEYEPIHYSLVLSV